MLRSASFLVLLFPLIAHPQTPADTTAADTAASAAPDPVIEVEPQFPGGTEQLYTYVRQNTRYPESCIDNGITGKVWVTFVIDVDGTVTDAKVARGVHPDLDAEAIRVVKGMPQWQPGYQSGKAVKVMYNLPITFSLSDGSSRKKKKKKDR